MSDSNTFDIDLCMGRHNGAVLK